MAVQRLFIERYSYFDMNRGRDAVMVRILRPLDRYYGADQKSLNHIGLYHLKSFFLVQVGILEKEANTWSGIVKRREPVDVHEAKREAFQKTQRGYFDEVEQFDDDTDVECDDPTPVFIQMGRETRDEWSLEMNYQGQYKLKVWIKRVEVLIRREGWLVWWWYQKLSRHISRASSKGSMSC